jgi:hypothetical protein
MNKVCKSFLVMVYIFFGLNIFTTYAYAEVETPEKAIERIYSTRNKAFTTGNLLSIKDCFDNSQKFGAWALEHEVRRIKYLKHWSEERKIEFINVESSLRIKKISVSGIKATLSLEESYKFDYIYPEDEPSIINSFGVGLRHGVRMICKNGNWVIYNDWYTDCFEDAISAYNGDIPQGSMNEFEFGMESNMLEKCLRTENSLSRNSYNREKAVQYADKYCGAAWGSGNAFKYNKIYQDFNGIGGDCTNYISQVLGDKKEGGGLPLGGGWHCAYSKYGKAEGSKAWVNADGLKGYLIYSGRGSVIKKGTFKDLSLTSDVNIEPAINKLQLGDLIAYEKKGDIDHVAVITGRDSRGYALVNSHTADRYHVPWDLGWGDKWIKFHLMHINY